MQITECQGPKGGGKRLTAEGHHEFFYDDGMFLSHGCNSDYPSEAD